MTLLIDSSVLFELEKDNKATIKKVQELSGLHAGRPCISFMTYVEFLYGVENRSEEQKAKSRQFLWSFSILHTTNETALWLVHLKQNYTKQMKSLADLFIASQAIEYNLTLVSKDKDFEDIKEIKKIIL